MNASNFRQMLPFLTVAGAAVGAATPAHAQGFQDINAIERRVVASLGHDIGEPGGPVAPVDRRLRLTACPAPLVVEPVVLGAATVRCQPIGWRIRVPVLRGAAPAVAPAQTEGIEAAPAPVRAPVRTARADYLVRRGDPIALVVSTGGFTVSRQAVADQDGAAGDRIRVRTEPRAAPIIGQVLPDGRVAMTGFN